MRKGRKKFQWKSSYLLYVGALIIFAVIVYFLYIKIQELVVFHPLSGGKDYLDILAAFAQIAGAAALFSLFYEIGRNNREDKKKSTPQLSFTDDQDILCECPAKDSILILCEKSVNELPKPEELASWDKYNDLYLFLLENDKKYLRLYVKNEQTNAEGHAYNLQMKLKITYLSDSSKNNPLPYVISSHGNHYEIKAGEKKEIFIRIGNVNREGYNKYQLDILDIKFENSFHKNFHGSIINSAVKHYIPNYITIILEEGQ